MTVFVLTSKWISPYVREASEVSSVFVLHISRRIEDEADCRSCRPIIQLMRIIRSNHAKQHIPCDSQRRRKKRRSRTTNIILKPSCYLIIEIFCIFRG